MLGICCWGPRPLSAISFMASKRSRRVSAGAVSFRLASSLPPILQFKVSIITKKVGCADSIVLFSHLLRLIE